MSKSLWLGAQAWYDYHARIGENEARAMPDLAARLIAALSKELET